MLVFIEGTIDFVRDDLIVGCVGILYQMVLLEGDLRVVHGRRKLLPMIHLKLLQLLLVQRGLLRRLTVRHVHSRVVLRAQAERIPNFHIHSCIRVVMPFLAITADGHSRRTPSSSLVVTIDISRQEI